jgi:hypothetical protein
MKYLSKIMIEMIIFDPNGAVQPCWLSPASVALLNKWRTSVLIIWHSNGNAGRSGRSSSDRRRRLASSASAPTICVVPARSSAGRPAAISSRSSFSYGIRRFQTTERYLGSEQEIVVAVNDNLGL